MINPFPLVWAIMRRHAVVSITFVLLIALAVGIGAAITAQERALRSGSARASDKFDLIVGAPGSQIDLLLRVVFLQPGAVELLAGEPERKLLGDQKADFVAPIGFGDSYEGHPIVGTIPQLVMHLSGEQLAEGRNFETPLEAVIGADTDLKLGDVFHARRKRGRRRARPCYRQRHDAARHRRHHDPVAAADLDARHDRHGLRAHREGAGSGGSRPATLTGRH